MAKRIIRLECLTHGFGDILLDNSQRIVTIGRGDESYVVIKSPHVSNNHCKIKQPRFLGPSVTDLKSMNGTYVDGKQIKPGRAVRFTHGSHLAFGTVFYTAWYEKKGGE